MTFAEYELLMEAAMLKWVDTDYRVHQQAFLNFAASAKKKKGKNKEAPVYNKFEKFYDYEDAQNSVKNRKKTNERFSAMKEFLRKKGGTNG